ncbi:MAG: 6-phosphogluconolactonase [Thermodesulfobacteriota bacterium]
MSQNSPEIIVCSDRDNLLRSAAQLFVEVARDSLSTRGRFCAALSGGATPPALYRLLASGEFRSQIDWGRVHLFWGDERCVPPDDKESNYRMAHETLISHVGMPESNIHRIKGERGEEAAPEYEDEIKGLFGLREGAFPAFDLMLLGLGEDGHTASLFPGADAVREEVRIVTALSPVKLETTRITLTPPAINNALHTIFIVAGRGKAAALREVLEGAYRPDTFPAQVTRHSKGQVTWIVDREAAGELAR